MKNKALHIGVGVLLLLSFVLIVQLLYWWIYPYDLMELKQPFKILTPTVQRGGMFVYEMDYCKKTDLVPVVNRQFVDGLVYILPVSSSSIKRGCNVIKNSVIIPASLPEGVYYLSSTVIYKVNPIRTITYEYRTDKFTVVK
jgi:hypothetical protein